MKKNKFLNNEAFNEAKKRGKNQAFKIEAKLYICHPFKGKCKLYNYPEQECKHATLHKKCVENCRLNCTKERHFICGGICKEFKL